jgi:uncharacterized membrane protein
MMFVPILLIMFILLYLRDKGDNHPSRSDRDAVLKLKERYIRGEIDEETYFRMKSVIE